LLLGTGLGSLLSRRVAAPRVRQTALVALVTVAAVAVAAVVTLPFVIDHAIVWPLPVRLGLAAALMTPLGVILGVALPSGMRLLADRMPALIPWGWGINGAFSVIGATLAVFIAMNWGFSSTLLCAAAIYVLAAVTLGPEPRIRPADSRSRAGLATRSPDSLA
jgi:hypothetical protein